MTTEQIVGLIIVGIILYLADVITEFENAPYLDDETNRFYSKYEYKKLLEKRKVEKELTKLN